jgi:hypothetical protein
MNCREFEDAWNDRLDHCDRPLTVPDPSLAAHESVCEDCRTRARGYRALLLALGESAVPVEAPFGFVDRVLAASATAASPRVTILGTLGRWGIPLSTAAAILVAVLVGLQGTADRQPIPGARLEVATVDADDLAAALAEVGSASLTLAREASAPAARVGTEVIEASGLIDGVAPVGLTVPGVSGSGATLWEGVGERVSASARPLAGTARSAFGFLVGIAPEG